MSHPVNPQAPPNQQPSASSSIPAPGSENSALIDAAQVSSILKMFQKVCNFILAFIGWSPFNVYCSHTRRVIDHLGHIM